MMLKMEKRFKIPHYDLRSNSFDTKYDPLNINYVLLL